MKPKSPIGKKEFREVFEEVMSDFKKEVKKNPLKMTSLQDVKGKILEKIIKRDNWLIFVSRDGMVFEVEVIPEYVEEHGEEKAEKERNKRLKEYKKRLDKLFGLADFITK